MRIRMEKAGRRRADRLFQQNNRRAGSAAGFNFINNLSFVAGFVIGAQ
ncbi:MAG: hypothetical protein Q4C60_07995 [Eubacteriales bacterium]|nr:hypothetical protein [Eubacteriales bacterium]